MIDADQIPYEVKRAMRVAWAMRSNDDGPEKHMADLAVALLNAWPGMRVDDTYRWLSDVAIILPMEDKNAES